MIMSIVLYIESSGSRAAFLFGHDRKIGKRSRKICRGGGRAIIARILAQTRLFVLWEVSR